MSTPLRVLILEDRADDAELMVRELRRAGFDPDWRLAQTEREYLAHLDESLDLILADYTLPQFDALLALHLLKERALDIPYIVVSGSISEEVAVECMKQGATDYLLKDRLARLGPAVTHALEQKRLRLDKQQAEDALRESDAQLRSLIESSPDHVLMLDTDLNIRYANYAAPGLTMEELMGTPLYSYVPEERQSEIREILENVLRTGELATYETEYDIPDGDTIHYESRVVPRRVHNEIIGLTLSARDMTERVQAEEALRKANRAYRTLSDCNQVVVRAAEETQFLQDVCRVIVETGGYRLAWVGYAEQDEQKTVRPVAQAGFEQGYLDTADITWADTERGRGPTGIAIRTGEPCAAQNILSDPDYRPWREEALKRDYASSLALPLIAGDRVFGALNIYAARPEAFDSEEIGLLSELAGDLAYGVMALRARAGRVQAEQALREREARLHSIFRAAPTGIGLVSDRVLLRVNDRICEMTGYSRDELIGQSARILYPTDEDFEYVGTEKYRQIGEHGAGTVETRWKRKDGQLIDVLLSSTPLDPADLSAGVTFTALDITQRMRAEQAERDQRALAEALADSAAALNSTLDFDEVLKRILDFTKGVVPHDGVNIMLLDQEKNAARVVRFCGCYAEHGLPEPDLNVWRSLDEFPLLHQLCESGQPLVIPDTHDHPDWSRYPETEWIRSFIGAPIRIEGKVIGVLNVDSATPGFFTQAHTERLRAFADQAAVAIQNARLYNAEQERRRTAETLREIDAALNSTLNLDEVLSVMLQQLRHVLPYDSASVLRLEGQQLTIAACEGFDRPDKVVGIVFPLDPAFPNHRVVESRAPLAIEDVTREYAVFAADADAYESGHIRSWLGLPLVAKDQVIGMIAVDRNEVNPYTPDEVDLAMHFASQAAAAVENARLYEEMETHSEGLEQTVAERTTELRRAKERVEAILNSAPDATLLLGPDGSMETGNPAFYRLFGYVQDEPRRLPLPDLAAPEHAAALEKTLRAVIEERQMQRLELVARRRDGSTFEAEAALAPIAERDAVLGVVCILRDISSFIEAGRLKDAFISNVTHELRTPLTSLKLNHRMLSINPERSDIYLGRLQRATDRLEHTIEDLLRLSRLDQGQVELKLAPTDLNALASQLADDYVPLAGERGLTLSFQGEPDLPPVTADAGLLGQVLSIFLTNAFNYTPAGGVVTVSTCVREIKGECWAGLSAADTGPGISPQDKPYLFERFFRGTVGQESDAPGTGLGLAIAKEIVERHNGWIEVESEGVPGKGATFTVWLPAAGKD